MKKKSGLLFKRVRYRKRLFTSASFFMRVLRSYMYIKHAYKKPALISKRLLQFNQFN